MGGKVHQVHNEEVYVLGSYVEDVDTMQKYANGQHCPDINGPRSVTVRYYCDKGISAIVRVIEKSTCVYEVSIADATICESDAFTENPYFGASLDSNDDGDKGVVVRDEPWLLVIEQVQALAINIYHISFVNSH